MDIVTIVHAILDGNFDDELDSVIEAVRQRRADLARRTFITLKVGDRVRLIGGQQYLQGATGTVTQKKQKNVVIDLDTPRGRYHKNISCPVGLLERLP